MFGLVMKVLELRVCLESIFIRFSNIGHGSQIQYLFPYCIITQSLIPCHFVTGLIQITELVKKPKSFAKLFSPSVWRI